MDLGVAPFDQLAVHPDLAVAVGHRHGALHRCLQRATILGGRALGLPAGRSSCHAASRPRSNAGSTLARRRASVQAPARRRCPSSLRPRLFVMATTCSIVMPRFSLALSITALSTWPSGAPRRAHHAHRALELQQQPEHDHGHREHEARPAVGLPRGDGERGQQPAEQRVHAASAHSARTRSIACSMRSTAWIVRPSIGLLRRVRLRHDRDREAELGGLAAAAPGRAAPAAPRRRGRPRRRR